MTTDILDGGGQKMILDMKFVALRLQFSSSNLCLMR